VTFLAIIKHRWTEIFASSTKLMKEFTLNVDKSFVHSIYREPTLPKIPLQNIVIESAGWGWKGGNYKNQLTVDDGCINIVKIYSMTIEKMELRWLNLTFNELAELLNATTRLEKLTLWHKEKYRTECEVNLTLPYLKVLIFKASISDMCEVYSSFLQQLFNLFKHSSSIEELRIELQCLSGFYLLAYPRSFYSFLGTLPNLKRLTLGSGICENTTDPAGLTMPLCKIETLHVDVLYAPRQFLQSQIGYLRELRLSKLPDVETMRLIFQDISLKSLYLKKTALILNYEKQHVRFMHLKYDFHTGLPPVIELLRLGKCKKLNFSILLTKLHFFSYLQHLKPLT
jgi:hypothetical protein